jgi:hypothetical protein
MTSPVWEETDEYCADCLTTSEQLYWAHDDKGDLLCKSCWKERVYEAMCQPQQGESQ